MGKLRPAFMTCWVDTGQIKFIVLAMPMFMS